MNKKYLLLCLLSTPAFAAAPGSAVLRAAFCPFQPVKARALFAPSIFHEASMEDFTALFAQQTEYYGACEKVTVDKSGATLEYRDASLPLRIEYAEGGKIQNFYFGRSVYKNDSFAKIAAFAARYLKKSSITVTKDGAPVFNAAGGQPLNVATNSNLFVLKALQDRVSRKELTPETIVRLDDATKSISAGFLHFWRAGTALTVDTLKNLMIAERDLTAADLLINAVGKDEIEKNGASLKPFLLNREFAQASALGAKQIPADKKSLAAMIASLPKPTDAVEYPKERYDLSDKLGWFASTQELCTAFYQLRDEKTLFGSFRAMTEEEGKERWSDYSLLPGRGWGVAQNSTLLRKKGGGAWYCISVTANNLGPVDEQAINDISSRIYGVIYAAGASSER